MYPLTLREGHKVPITSDELVHHYGDLELDISDEHAKLMSEQAVIVDDNLKSEAFYVARDLALHHANDDPIPSATTCYSH